MDGGTHLSRCAAFRTCAKTPFFATPVRSFLLPLSPAFPFQENRVAVMSDIERVSLSRGNGCRSVDVIIFRGENHLFVMWVISIREYGKIFSILSKTRAFPFRENRPTFVRCVVPRACRVVMTRGTSLNHDCSFLLRREKKEI